MWTAGVRANPANERFGLPLDERGASGSSRRCRSKACRNVWALGDGARVPNLATPGEFDPPTCQHALRQARRLAKNLRRRARSRTATACSGQVATLGRYKGIAQIPGLAAPRLPGLVRHPDVPPVPAAAPHAEAARRRRLDDGALLPPRHRRARACSAIPNGSTPVNSRRSGSSASARHGSTCGCRARTSSSSSSRRRGRHPSARRDAVLLRLDGRPAARRVP